jgi:hypothetical protein
MHSEEFQKVKTKVPFDLWNKVEALGFKIANETVINAFEEMHNNYMMQVQTLINQKYT